MPLNYDPDIPDVVVPTPNTLRRVSKLLRQMASGQIPELPDIDKKNQYKQLLFTAAKGIDEAAKLLPEPKPEPTPTQGHPWWCWLLLGGASIAIPFFLWVAYERFLLGNRIGFIP